MKKKLKTLDKKFKWEFFLIEVILSGKIGKKIKILN